MFSKREVRLVVLHDLDQARDALQEALSTADGKDAPGLRRALDLLQEMSFQDGDVQREWARRVIGAAGIDPVDDHVKAVRELRRVLPGLSLPAAARLVREVKTSLP